MEENSLKRGTKSGVIWSFIDVVSRYGITFLVSIVLARLLSPEEYGLIGILIIFIELFNVIVDGGFTNAIIRKQNADEKDYSTIFYTNLGVSLFLCLLLILGANSIASFFGNQQLSSLTIVMSSIVVINALAIVPKAKLTKSIDFKSQTIIMLIASIVGGFVGIILALMGAGVWSLALQQVSCQTVNTIGLWIIVRWMPSKQFSINSFMELWGYGWKLLVSGVLGSLWSQLYQVVIGKYYSPTSLGLYTRASQFSSLCSNNISSIIQKVSFPVLSKIQDDTETLTVIYSKMVRVSMLVTFVSLFGMAACAKSMIYVLLGEKWLECVPMLQLLCVSMTFIPLHGINSIAIQVVGRSDITLKLNIYKCFINTMPLIIGVFAGLYWMLASSIVSNLLCYLLNVLYSRNLIHYGFFEQVRDILPSLAVAISVFMITYTISIIDINMYALFLLQLFVGVSSCFLICKLFNLKEFNEILKFAVNK